MGYKLYFYRAPTPSECEAGDMAPGYHPDECEAATLRDVITEVNDRAPDFGAVSGIDASSWPVQRGDWVTITYQSGEQVNVFRRQHWRGTDRAQPTAASIKRVIAALLRHV